MSAKNELEVLRMGHNRDLDILNPAEQDEILGGDTETHCQKGYSTFLATICLCGYKRVVTEDEEEGGDDDDNP